MDTHVSPILTFSGRTLSVPFTRFADGTFAQRIRKQRIEKGLTQKELATEADLSTDLVYRWERGLHGASARTVSRVSAVLGVSPTYLRTGRGGHSKQAKASACER
jgi:transcriptional regulator with XRE-family HTH domain